MTTILSLIGEIGDLQLTLCYHNQSLLPFLLLKRVLGILQADSSISLFHYCGISFTFPCTPVQGQ